MEPVRFFEELDREMLVRVNSWNEPIVESGHLGGIRLVPATPGIARGTEHVAWILDQAPDFSGDLLNQAAFGPGMLFTFEATATPGIAVLQHAVLDDHLDPALA